MSWIEPLNLKYILVNVLAGNLEIFTFLSFLVIAAMAAKFQMPNSVTLLMFAIFVIIMNTYLGLGGIYLLVILIVGLVSFFGLKKIWE